MEKKSTKIAYFVALGVFIVLLVILGIQFKGKENPVFVGDGAFYTTGDGVFLDGILKTADDSEGSKYALDGSYYVSPEAGTYFELSEDGNTIVGADGTEYVKSEEKSKDVNGVEYTTYEEQVYSETPFAGTFWSLLPPIVAIVLALISKEVYSSLFLGCLVGALLYTQFAPWDTIVTLVGADYGIISVLADSGNMGIIVFLVTLGIMVDLMNKGGGSEAFGRWAKKTVHTRCGAQLLTMLLGVLIFIDDYFNCLTVGAVMRPVTESHKISRAKLAYLIDATAAPVCMIAPVSSWAAAVSGYVQSPSINGIELFLKQIPWNYYCLLTLLMIVVISLLNIDYGSMLTHEYNAQVKDDLFTTPERPFAGADDYETGSKGKSSVLDLILPVIVLIATCIIGLIYTGGFYEAGGEYAGDFMGAFSNASSGQGLAIGSMLALVFTFIYFWLRGAIGFEKSMESVPQGFIQMIAPILILTFAWTLCSFTRNAMYSADFVSNAMANVGDLRMFLPAIIFIIGAAIGFATGTSWGTIGIMAPIVVSVFNYDAEPILCTIGLAAACSGGVMGDHCSPISDTTIMASAGAHCSHVNHVSTQLPYAMTAAAISAGCYLLCGAAQAVLGDAANTLTSFVLLACAIVIELVVLSIVRARMGHTGKEEVTKS